MSCLGWLIGGGVVAALFGMSRDEQKKEQKKIEAQRSRKNSWHGFKEPISKNDFYDIISAVTKKNRKHDRLLGFVIDNAEVTVTVQSQHKRSSWTFCVDFNDYGDLTGRYYFVDHGKDESNIPDHFANCVSEEIAKRL